MKEQILREAVEKREQCVKHFQLAQKGMAAAVYPVPVHFQKNGKWEEIDNRLVEDIGDGNEIYRNQASAMEVRFAKKANQGHLVTIRRDGRKIAWNLECAESKSVFKRTEAEVSPENTEVDEKMKMKHLISAGVYEEILPGTDIRYTVQGERVKEDIILKSREAAGQAIVFRFLHPGMEMKKEEDGSVGIYTKEQECIFRLAKPYLYDGEGNYTAKAEFRAEPEANGCRIEIIPDREWLLAKDRVYPVIIDPMTETSKTKGNIEDTYIFSGGTNNEDPAAVYAYGSFSVGTSTGAGKIRAMLRFRNLPDIGNGSIIYAATMYMWQYQYSSFGTETIPLMAHEVKSSWEEKTVRWSNQPPIDSTVLDYKKAGQVKNGTTITITPIGFDVTRLVRQWYNTGNNYGILVRSQYEDSTVTAQKAYARFYASDSPSISSAQFPSGVFYYRNVSGLEDYQSYHGLTCGTCRHRLHK